MAHPMSKPTRVHHPSTEKTRNSFKETRPYESLDLKKM